MAVTNKLIPQRKPPLKGWVIAASNKECAMRMGDSHGPTAMSSEFWYTVTDGLPKNMG